MFKITDESDVNTMEMEVNNISVSMVNGIRRVIHADVPTVAIAFDAYHPEQSDIKFQRNTSSINNEMLGHRIGLVPVHVPIDEIDSYDPAAYEFSINVHNRTKDGTTRDVTTDDIMIKDMDGNTVPTHDLFPLDPITNDPILLVKLKANPYNPDKGEELAATFCARKGIAKQNARWSPVCIASYVYKLDDEKVKLARAQITDSKGLNKFDTLDKFRPEFCIKNEHDEPCSFIFRIETTTSYTPREVFSKALTILQEKAMDIADNPDKIGDIQTISEDTHMYSVVVIKEDHTLSNVLQVFMFDRYIRDEKAKDLTYIGYYQPHPLESDILCKLQFTKAKSAQEIRSFFQNACVQLANRINEYVESWAVAALAPDVTKQSKAKSPTKSKAKSVRKT